MNTIVTLRCTHHTGMSTAGEAYEALVAFLDEGSPSWRADLKRDMTKAVRADGKVRVRGSSFTLNSVPCIRG